MNRILFSPIGHSDPIRGNYDGAWLHICRHYKPRLCEIFLTAEITSRDQKSDIYARTLELLNQSLFGDDCDSYIRLQKHTEPELVEAHSLEVFFPLFRERLTQLHEQYPDAELLVNISSGTPGMKNTLACLYHLLPFNITLVQVSNPNYKGAPEKTIDDTYDVEAEWELNCDNEEGINRCREEHMANLLFETQINDIKKSVQSREYYLAYEKALQIKDRLSPKAVTALEGAMLRSRMFSKRAGIKLAEAGWTYGNTINGSIGKQGIANAFTCSEFLLMMETAVLHGSYAEYLRNLTPLLCDVCELTLAKYGKDVRKGGVENDRWRVGYMDPEWLKIIETALKGRELSDYTNLATSNMLPLIREFCPSDVFAKVDALRKVENAARNVAAHEIEAIDEKWIEQKGGMSVPKITKALKELINNLNALPKEQWESYESMNDFICELLTR